MDPPQWEPIFQQIIAERGADFAKIQYQIGRIADSAGGYLHWTKFRHHRPWPEGLTPEEGWAVVQYLRYSTARWLPLLDKHQQPIRVVITDPLRAMLYRIDQHRCLLEAGMPERPTFAEKEEMSSYSLKALIEESYYSAVIEGAVSTRKDAKRMIREKKEPRDQSEQMILNNYNAGSKMTEWAKQPMSKKLILEIQETLTVGTLENDADVGRLRVGPVQIWNDATEEVVFVPPEAESLEERISRICTFANQEESDEEFIHPIIKAALLHFQLAYDHPFGDGNGRTARWLMLWFLLRRQDYWWVAMLSISRMTQHTRRAYYDSFLFAESDRTDATYLVRHQVGALEAEMNQFAEFLSRRQMLLHTARRRLRVEKGLNLRQLAIFDDLSQNLSAHYTQQEHAAFHGITQPTARRDLEDLVLLGLLRRQEGRPVIYHPTSRFRAAAEGVRSKR